MTLDRKHWGNIYTKLCTYWRLQVDRTNEAIYYDALKDRLTDDQLDGAFRHIIKTASSSVYFPKVDDLIGAASDAWTDEKLHLAGQACAHCDEQGYGWLVELIAEFDMGDHMEKRRAYLAADEICGEHLFDRWMKPAGWTLYHVCAPCQCEKGQKKIRAVERSNADPKADEQRPVPSHYAQLTGRNTPAHSYDLCMDLEATVGRMLTTMWGAARGARRFFGPDAERVVPAPVPAKTVASAMSRLVNKPATVDAGQDTPCNSDGIPFF